MAIATTIEARIGTHIRVSKNALPYAPAQRIIDALTIGNPDRDRALRELVRGAEQMPKWIDLWHTDGDDVVIPRGFVFEFEEILRQADVSIDWQASMVWSTTGRFQEVDPIPLDPYQLAAVEEMQQALGGILVAPTASGKTRIMLELIRRLGQKSIVFVEKVDLSQQWVTAALELGYSRVRIIGDGEWDDSAGLTIALRQSLWARHDQLEAAWYDQFGMVVVDEAHHLSGSDTAWEIIQRFRAMVRMGCTATPDEKGMTFPIAKAIIGPIAHRTTHEDAAERLMVPSVRVHDTDFDFDYIPTHREGRRRVGNNYSAMMDALQLDAGRNAQIVRLALADAIDGHAVLILSRRKEHLKAMIRVLEALLGEFSVSAKEVPYFLVTGDNSSAAEAVYSAIGRMESGCMLFSTIADEGTDIPRLDRLYLAYPGRKLLPTEQAVGRIMRMHPGKDDAIINDFRDQRVDLLRDQFRQRAQDLWNARGYQVERV